MGSIREGDGRRCRVYREERKFCNRVVMELFFMPFEQNCDSVLAVCRYKGVFLQKIGIFYYDTYV